VAARAGPQAHARGAGPPDAIRCGNAPYGTAHHGSRYLWSPDETGVATWAASRQRDDDASADRVFVIGLAGKKQRSWPAPPAFDGVLSWNPAGDGLLLKEGTYGNPEARPAEFRDPIPIVARTLDGARKAEGITAMGDCSHLFPVPGTTKVLTFEFHGLFLNDLKTKERARVQGVDLMTRSSASVCSPSGRYVAYATYYWVDEKGNRTGPSEHNLTPTVLALVIVDLESRTARTIGAIPDEGWSWAYERPPVAVRWTPDSKHVVRCVASRDVKLRDGERGKLADGVIYMTDVKTGETWEAYRYRGTAIQIDWTPVEFKLPTDKGAR
jgi:hypothetical protein